MDLPTFLVILFLSKGTVYTNVEPAPSHQECLDVLKDVPAMLARQVKEPIQYYAASCEVIKPFTKDS